MPAGVQVIARAPGRPEQDVKHPLLRAQSSGNRTLTALESDTALQVCEQIALGETLAKVCHKDNTGIFPSHITFLRWVLLHPWVKQAYDAARQLRSYALEDEALDAARDARGLHKDKVPGVRTMLEQLRWSAERGNPAEFAPKGVTNTVVPVQINTTLNLGQPGAEEVQSPENVWKIEALVPGPAPLVAQGFPPHSGPILDLTADAPPPVAPPRMDARTGPRKRQLIPKVLADGSENPAWAAEVRAINTAAQQARRARERGEHEDDGN